MSPQTVAEVAGDCLERVKRPYDETMAVLASNLGRIRLAGHDGSLSDLTAALDDLPDMFAALAVLRMSLPSRESLARRVVNGTFRDLRALRAAYIEAAEHDRTAIPLRGAAINGSREDAVRCGYFEMRLADGTWGSLQRRPDDCVRAGLATLLQTPMYLLPRIYPADLRPQGVEPDEEERIVYGMWDDWLDTSGVNLRLHSKPPTDNRRWLAIVGEGAAAHCLIVRGADVIFDCGWVTPPLEDQEAARLADLADEFGGFSAGFTLE